MGREDDLRMAAEVAEQVRVLARCPEYHEVYDPRSNLHKDAYLPLGQLHDLLGRSTCIAVRVGPPATDRRNPGHVPAISKLVFLWCQWRRWSTDPTGIIPSMARRLRWCCQPVLPTDCSESRADCRDFART